MRGTGFEIVGVIRSLGNSQVNDQEMQRDNRKIYIPITTLKQFSGTQAVEAIIFKVPDERPRPRETEAKALLKRAPTAASRTSASEHRRGDRACAQRRWT